MTVIPLHGLSSPPCLQVLSSHHLLSPISLISLGGSGGAKLRKRAAGGSVGGPKQLLTWCVGQ